MNQSTYNTLKSFIWGIANDCLVDVYDVGDYRKIILPMFVIRRFDAVLEPKHEEVIKAKEQFEKAGITELDAALSAVAEQAFVNKSDFILTDLKSRTNQQQLKKDFIAYLDGFSENVQVIINKFHIRNEIDRLSEQDRLGLLIEKFVDPRINLSNRPILNEDGSVKIEALDNHTMGTLFEEVIRMFNEETNVTDAGRHFTPRDIVELIADLAFIPIQDKIQSTTYRIYDGACGTGGMLTVGDQHIRELAAEQGKKVSIHLYGQENADETYAIARADMLVKGEGKESDQIRFGSTISDDKFAKEEFDFMLSNPPFGTPWKTDLKAYGSIEWEKLSIYLSFLVSKLPKPDTGNADEIIEDVELESYRLVAQDTISIKLEDVDSEIDPVPVKTDVGIPVPEYDTLSNILASFHEKWGNCGWTDEDRVRKQIADLPDIVAQDETYQNAMKYSDAQNARDESDRTTYDAILKSLVSGTELYKAFSDDIRNKNNQSFKKWLLDYVFNVTYKPESRV